MFCLSECDLTFVSFDDIGVMITFTEGNPSKMFDNYLTLILTVVI